MVILRIFILILWTPLKIVLLGPSQEAVLAKWIGALDLGSLVREDEGSNPSILNYLV
jgi:hypothetical protein